MLAQRRRSSRSIPRETDMARSEPYAAKGVYDPPIYAQAVKVVGAQTILYIAGQVAYTPEGGAAYPGDFKAQARAAL
jgi:enamine deaminase RidA (YjgF/YER057c/UK114 family)